MALPLPWHHKKLTMLSPGRKLIHSFFLDGNKTNTLQTMWQSESTATDNLLSQQSLFNTISDFSQMGISKAEIIPTTTFLKFFFTFYQLHKIICSMSLNTPIKGKKSQGRLSLPRRGMAMFHSDSQQHITLETPAVQKGARHQFEADPWPLFGHQLPAPLQGTHQSQ